MKEKPEKKNWSYQSLSPETRRATHKAVKDELFRRWRSVELYEASLPFDVDDEADLRYGKLYLSIIDMRLPLLRLHAQLTGRESRGYGTEIEIRYRRYHIKYAANKIAKETGVAYETVVEELMYEMSDYLQEF